MPVNLLTPEMLAELQSLQLRARTLVESVLTGTHRGQQRGFSIDFAEHRDYSPGDDVRFLDWKLYGRRDRFYVRQFEDENQLEAWVVLDVSRSMLYKSSDSALSKIEYAACLAAAIGWIACYQRDRSALLSFDQAINTIGGPFYGSVGAQELLKQLESILEDTQHGSESSVRNDDDEQWHGLQLAAERVPQKAILFLLTDAFGDISSMKRSLTLLKRKKCDVRLVHVLDAAEISFPFEGSMLFRDLEGAGEQQVTAQFIRTSYQEEVQTFLNELQQMLREVNVDYLFTPTSAPLNRVLQSMLHSRHAK